MLRCRVYVVVYPYIVMCSLDYHIQYTVLVATVGIIRCNSNAGDKD